MFEHNLDDFLGLLKGTLVANIDLRVNFSRKVYHHDYGPCDAANQTFMN